MGEVYSHSKLWLFENCPEAYKIKYIDRSMPKLPSSIHAFLGSMVHDSLEWLYGQVMLNKTPECDELIRKFAENWQDNFEMDLRIPTGENVQEFFNKGIKFLIRYYNSNFPFHEDTIHLEKRIIFPISEDVKIMGFVDRIVKKGFNEYEVHDYKTNSKMKSQEEVDKDRQLAFYHLGLQELFGEDINVSLIWHFLAHDKKIVSSRTQDELNKLKFDTLNLIETIKFEKEWKACGKKWCDWCSHKRSMKFFNKGNHDLRGFF
ncbi:MAG: PD-(D/E)XK nuclease family protein [Nanoarchaeota archaeon]|nr:PD-(D/E)XK nuclease family protein [Nanoarchaeota archaeon]